MNDDHLAYVPARTKVEAAMFMASYAVRYPVAHAKMAASNDVIHLPCTTVVGPDPVRRARSLGGFRMHLAAVAAATLGAAAHGLMAEGRASRDYKPEKTQADFEALQKAQRKRERKAALKAR